MGSSIDLLARHVRQAFDHRSWHGTNLWGSIRALGAAEAAWRPEPGRHNVWELTVHAAYWKYRVYRHLTSAPPRSFDVRGSNFFARPDAAGSASWDDDRELLRAWQERLLAAIEAFDPARLSERAGRDRYSFEDLILGIAAHDLYHTGQIQLLKRLRESASDQDR